jgi:hypothetical protein
MPYPLPKTTAEFDPQCGAHPFVRDAVCPRSRIVVCGRPPAICGWPMGDYKILHGRLLSEKAAVETCINMRPGPYALY